MRGGGAALCAAAAAAARGADPLGPGTGAWVVEPPGAHGLDAAALAAAEAELFGVSEIGRGCLVVVKDGALVYEGYAGGYAGKAHAGYSMTKSLGALIAGWAVQHAGFDIDADITAKYGVASPKPYPVTSRQVMSQAVAGQKGPGQKWEYDSAGNYWINHLAHVVPNATGRKPSEIWATEFQKPLGLSEGFWGSGADSMWAAGASGTCREWARVGQLLLNGGRWKGVGGGIVPADYIREMGTPQTRYAPYTEYSNSCYGLLTWLNPRQDPAKYPGQCLVPGASFIRPGSDPIANSSLWPRGAPSDIFFAGGAYGQIAMAIPEHNAVVVTMGKATAGHDSGGYHDYTAACLYRALCKVFGDCAS